MDDLTEVKSFYPSLTFSLSWTSLEDVRKNEMVKRAEAGKKGEKSCDSELNMFPSCPNLT